jgi:integrase
LPPSPKFEQIAVRYLAKSKLVNKPQSYKCARVSLRRLRAFFGPRTIDSLKAADLRRYMEKRLLTVTPAFVNRDLRYLKAVLRFAIDEGVIGKLPFKIQLLRTTKRLPTFLSESELTRLFAHASERIRPMLMTAAMTGLRAGELRALEWCDVDLEMRVLRVCAKVEIEFSPKSHAEREVPLNGQLVAILKAHRETLLIADGRAPVFQRNPQTGSRWDDSGQLREVRQAFIDAGLYNRDSRPGLHMLRRSFASHALKFTDIETVRELGGWSELGVVQRYVASSGPRKRAAVERLVFDERDD